MKQRRKDMIKVFNIKDLIKCTLGMACIILIVWVAIKWIGQVKTDKRKEEKPVSEEVVQENGKQTKTTFLSCLDRTIPGIKQINKEEINDEDEALFIHYPETGVTNRGLSRLEKLLTVELGMMDTVKTKEEKTEQETQEQTKETEQIEMAKTDVKTEVIDNGGISNKYTNTYGSVQIRNESNYELTEEILTPDITIEDNKDILLFHTHTCESYTASEKYEYEMTGTYRTTDLNYTVARVGEELKKHLDSYGYEVVHDSTYHDYPAYTGSYNKSLVTVTSLLKKKPETQIVFDVHRDAIGSNSQYAPTVKIGEEAAAQIMFVMGTDGGGLEHSNWQQNLKFAVKVQEKANELYPGLMKPIILRNSRYNQHVTKAAGIIEVGATGNTLDQCLTSMKYFSKVLSEVLQ